MTVVLFHDLFDRRQAQAGPAPLGREKRFKHFAHVFGWNGRTVVLDRDLDLTARSRMSDFDIEMPARRHSFE